MKKHTVLPLITGLALTATIYGCAQPPQDQLDAAQNALVAADESEADVYVADLYVAAEDSFEAAQLEIEAQNAASSFSRDYDRAENLLAYVQQTATEAQAQVESRKETMRTMNEEMFLQAEQAIARTQELMTQAPRGKDGAVALVAIQQDAGTATQLLADARAAHESGSYAQAHDLAKSALDQANALIAELETAIGMTQPAAPIS